MRNFTFPALMALGLGLLTGCASLPQNFTREDSTRLSAEGTTLAREFAALSAEHPGLSGAYPLSKGVEALAARVALARRAEKSLDVQYYIWNGDDSGRLLLKELLAAADRGVRVRVLLDDLGVGAANDDVFRWVDAHPKVSVVLFNPVALRNNRTLGLVADPRRLNRRMHNKSMTADGTVTVVGGRNIGNEYFALDELVNFADMDVLAIGPVAEQVAESFDEYWNSAAAIPVSAFHPEPASAEDLARGRAALDDNIEQRLEQRYRQVLASQPESRFTARRIDLYWTKITALYDSPGKAKPGVAEPGSGETEDMLLLQQLGNLLGQSRSDLLIVSPYFVPGKAGTEALLAAVKRGVRVRVLTNSLASTDVAAVHAGYRKSRRALLEGGVELFEMMPGLDVETGDHSRRSVLGSSGASLHAKMFVVDAQKVFIGSMNLDPRSVRINTEIGLLIDSPELAGDLLKQIGGLLELACYRLELQPKSDSQDAGRKELVWIENREGEQLRHTNEPQTTFWQRFSVGFIGLFPIDSQL